MNSRNRSVIRYLLICSSFACIELSATADSVAPEKVTWTHEIIGVDEKPLTPVDLGQTSLAFRKELGSIREEAQSKLKVVKAACGCDLPDHSHWGTLLDETGWDTTRIKSWKPSDLNRQGIVNCFQLAAEDAVEYCKLGKDESQNFCKQVKGFYLGLTGGIHFKEHSNLHNNGQMIQGIATNSDYVYSDGSLNLGGGCPLNFDPRTPGKLRKFSPFKDL